MADELAKALEAYEKALKLRLENEDFRKKCRYEEKIMFRHLVWVRLCRAPLMP